MGMIGACIDMQLPDHLTAKLGLRQHAFHSLLNQPLRVLAGQDLVPGPFLDAARVAGVPVELLVCPLIAGDCDFVRIHDDDMVAAIHMRRVKRFVFAAQANGYARRKTA